MTSSNRRLQSVDCTCWCKMRPPVYWSCTTGINCNFLVYDGQRVETACEVVLDGAVGCQPVLSPRRRGARNQVVFPPRGCWFALPPCTFFVSFLFIWSKTNNTVTGIELQSLCFCFYFCWPRSMVIRGRILG